jgi:hypothetical protein
VTPLVTSGSCTVFLDNSQSRNSYIVKLVNRYLLQIARSWPDFLTFFKQRQHLGSNQVLSIGKFEFSFIVGQNLLQIFYVLILDVLFSGQLSHSTRHVFISFCSRHRNSFHNIDIAKHLRFFVLILFSLQAVLQHYFFLFRHHDFHQFNFDFCFSLLNGVKNSGFLIYLVDNITDLICLV